MPEDNGPRISVNKLGEYLVQADSARRRRIIQDQKQPIGRIVSAYREARDAIVQVLSGAGGPTLLQRATQLAGDRSGTPKAVTNRLNSALALEKFVDVLNALPDGVVYVAPPRRPPALVIAGVDVSVAPDLLVHGAGASGPTVGALKLHFPKDDERALGANGSQFVAVLLHRWLLANPVGARRAAPDLCLSVDVFRQTVHCAPRAQQRRLERIEDGCEEIAARWPRL